MAPDVLDRIGGLIHDTFMSGTGRAFTVAGVVFVALVATLTSRGANREAGAGRGRQRSPPARSRTTSAALVEPAWPGLAAGGAPTSDTFA
jgi:hypothetical protein